MMKNRAGFTLIETLVALVIFAVAATALMRGMGNQIDNTEYLSNKTIAALIADSRLNYLHASGQWPNLGTTDGQISEANREWVWRMDVSNTAAQDFRRITLSISLASTPDDTITTITGFVGRH